MMQNPMSELDTVMVSLSSSSNLFHILFNFETTTCACLLSGLGHFVQLARGAARKTLFYALGHHQLCSQSNVWWQTA